MAGTNLQRCLYFLLCFIFSSLSFAEWIVVSTYVLWTYDINAFYHQLWCWLQIIIDFKFNAKIFSGFLSPWMHSKPVDITCYVYCCNRRNEVLLVLLVKKLSCEIYFRQEKTGGCGGIQIKSLNVASLPLLVFF